MSQVPNPFSPVTVPAAGKRAGIVESMVIKLFTRQARVESVEMVNPKFSIVTLQQLHRVLKKIGALRLKRQTKAYFAPAVPKIITWRERRVRGYRARPYMAASQIGHK
ncbi:hypothetical protein SAMN04488135_102296 [Pollutimonas bauzanensis]|uniref:Uncharacterized protein n=2 Tax=Pollutimonas bauzanensis TaxID=658167 RepID=A0A1M5QKK8_9BURK|nr:hypothetical protein SAMN04488135_102296 [Pollutimonas bauzanensis]